MTRPIRYLIPLFSAALLSAQTETGQITGTVADRNGHGLSLASISASSKLTGFTRHVKASGRGVYNVAALPPGNYTVEVSAEGFAGSSREIHVGLGARVGLDFVLQGKTAPSVQARHRGSFCCRTNFRICPT